MTVCGVLQVFQIRAKKRAQIPAVTHVDGSSRPQTFYRHTNSRYHHVIERFRDLTDAPMVRIPLSTKMGRWFADPKRRSTALSTKLDALVIGDAVMVRR